MLRVLIVDDEPLVRTGIRYRIPWGEYRMQVVAEAGSVQEAIAVLQGQEIDVVFTDIVMPGGERPGTAAVAAGEPSLHHLCGAQLL